MRIIFGVRPIERKMTKEDDVEVLTEESLHYLYLMSSSQLEAIYKHGKRKVQIDNDPEAYRYLYLMSDDQLKAIFGDEY